jgi:hypothetical protein
MVGVYHQIDSRRGLSDKLLGAWVGIMIIMALADWFLPFVYNIGFPGFQASVLIWMFFGGLVALEQLVERPDLQGSLGSLDGSY